MSAKITKINGFKDALDYNLNMRHGRIIGGNMTGNSAKALADEFASICKLHPQISKPVAHVSLFPECEKIITDDQWVTIGQRYLVAMGFKHHQYVIIRHDDNDHGTSGYIHILVNRISFDGTNVIDNRTSWKHDAAIRKILRDFGLSYHAPSLNLDQSPMVDDNK